MAIVAIKHNCPDLKSNTPKMGVLCLMSHQSLTKAEGLLSQGLAAICEMSLLEDEFDDFIDRPTAEIQDLIEKFRLAIDLNQSEEMRVVPGR